MKSFLKNKKNTDKNTHAHTHTHTQSKMKLERVTSWCENINTPLFRTTPILPTPPFSCEKSGSFSGKFWNEGFQLRVASLYLTLTLPAHVFFYIYIYISLYLYIYIYIYLIYMYMYIHILDQGWGDLRNLQGCHNFLRKIFVYWKSKKSEDSMFHNNVYVFIIIPALLYLLHFAIIT